MNNATKKILSIASPPLLEPFTRDNALPNLPTSACFEQLLSILEFKNGFFVFESALHVFPVGKFEQMLTLESWNDKQLWRNEYHALIPSDMVFFAQDIFGNQFGIDSSGVSIFYSEFAEIEPLSKDLHEWMELLLNDWKALSGYELCHRWQEINGPLREGERLIPKIPFVLGGKYSLENLYTGSILEAQRFRGSLALQIANIPDGSKIELKIQ